MDTSLLRNRTTRIFLHSTISLFASRNVLSSHDEGLHFLSSSNPDSQHITSFPYQHNFSGIRHSALPPPRKTMIACHIEVLLCLLSRLLKRLVGKIQEGSFRKSIVTICSSRTNH